MGVAVGLGVYDLVDVADGVVVGSPVLASACAWPKINSTAEMSTVTAAATAASLER